MNLDFPGVAVTTSPEFMHVRSEQPLHVLSSASLNGGYVETRDMINRHVDKTYHVADVLADQLQFAHQRGISEPFVGLLTAVYLDKARSCTRRDGGLTVAAIVTAGVGNAACAGVSAPAQPRPGTINTILLLDANLTPAAMVNAVITATEAKTHVLLGRGVRTPDGDPATGTSTDTVVVACTGRGDLLPYAGPITRVGWLIGACVRQCLEEALS
jgi:iron complex transport system ATP-binding protein